MIMAIDLFAIHRRRRRLVSQLVRKLVATHLSYYFFFFNSSARTRFCLHCFLLFLPHLSFYFSSFTSSPAQPSAFAHTHCILSVCQQQQQQLYWNSQIHFLIDAYARRNCRSDVSEQRKKRSRRRRRKKTNLPLANFLTKLWQVWKAITQMAKAYTLLPYHLLPTFTSQWLHSVLTETVFVSLLFAVFQIMKVFVVYFCLSNLLSLTLTHWLVDYCSVQKEKKAAEFFFSFFPFLTVPPVGANNWKFNSFEKMKKNEMNKEKKKIKWVKD